MAKLWEPHERYWVYYRGHENFPHRTGFLETLEDAQRVRDNLAKFEHITDLTIEKITPVDV